MVALTVTPANTRWGSVGVDAISSPTGEGQALAQLEDYANEANMTSYTADGTGGNVTLSVAQTVNAVYRSTAGTTATITTPTAAAIVAGLVNAQVGSSFDLTVQNGGSGTATMAGGTGVTIVGTTTLPTVTSQIFKGIVTNATPGAEAVSLVAVLKTAS